MKETSTQFGLGNEYLHVGIGRDMTDEVAPQA